MQNSVGINSQAIHKLSLSLQNYYYLRLQAILKQSIDIAKETVEIYDAESAKQFRRQFSNFAGRFNVLNNNILNYTKTLFIIEKKYNNAIEKFTLDFKK